MNKLNDIHEPNIVLCLAVQFLSHGPSKKKKQKKQKKNKKKKKKNNKDFIKQDQLSNHIVA